METRANYLLIGLFTLAGIVGMFAFFLWFARVELDRAFAYYDIDFTSVSGLNRAADVRFSGLPVGQVVGLGLSPDADGRVRVRIEVASETPVRTDSIATVEAQGVTGVSYVAIAAGTPEAPLLTAVTPVGEVPRIEAGRSVLQSLSEDAPRLLSEILTVAERLGEILSDDNAERVDRILRNVDDATGNFAEALDNFSDVSGSVALAASEIAAFGDLVHEIARSAEITLTRADDALDAVTELARRGTSTLDRGDSMLDSATAAFDAAEAFIAADLELTLREARDTAAELRLSLSDLTEDAGNLFEEFRITGRTATARLTEAEATLAAADEMLARLTETLGTIDSAAGRLDHLLEGDGAALVAEARETMGGVRELVARIDAVAEIDLPEVVADIREATGTINRVVAEVGADLTGVSGRIDGLSQSAETALAAVTETFGNANDTLAAFNEALDTGGRTLAAAERAFEGADRVINEDVADIVADLRSSLGRLDEALDTVSADLPVITGDLRRATEAATTAFSELRDVISASGGSVREFTATALPQYARLGGEIRALVRNLDRLTAQIQRDPARFFLSRQAPEFRR